MRLAQSLSIDLIADLWVSTAGTMLMLLTIHVSDAAHYLHLAACLAHQPWTASHPDAMHLV